jgi:phosphate transport system substrate-binding protein
MRNTDATVRIAAGCSVAFAALAGGCAALQENVIGTTAASSPTPSAVAAVAAAPAPRPARQPAAATQVLRLHGSNTIGLGLAPKLARAFLIHEGAANVAVQKGDADPERVWVRGRVDGKDLAIEVWAPGSKQAFESLGRDACDVGMASRDIHADEAERLRALGDLTGPSSDHVIAIDGIAVIVNKRNPVGRLSVAQVAALFDGEAADWSKVGGRPGPVHVQARDGKSGTFDAFGALVLHGKPLLKEARPFEDSAALASAVAADEAAIGFVGLPYVGGAKAVALQEGATAPLFPTVFTVATEDYPLSRRLHLYTAEKPKNPLTRPFVDFALSDEGQKIVEETGFVSLAVRADSPVVPQSAPPAYKHEIQSAQRLSVDFRFRSGSADLDVRSRADVDRVLRFLSAPGSRGKHTCLFGFADNQGGEPVNAELSKKRADAVAGELRQRGVAPELVAGLGSALPVASNDTADGRERNRRVEIWIR